GAISVGKGLSLAGVKRLESSGLSEAIGGGLTHPLTHGFSYAIARAKAGGSLPSTITLPRQASIAGATSAVLAYNARSNSFEEFLDSKGRRLYQVVDRNRDGVVEAMKLNHSDGDAAWDGDGKRDGSVLIRGYVVSGQRAFVGTANGDVLIGNALANTLQGLAGDDDLQGGLSRDILNGGLGDDSLDGGLGADRITGGRGSDVIVYRRVDESTPDDTDTVTLDRFDRFDLRALDGDSALAGQQTFQFIGSQAFSGVAGELRATRSLLAADTDGDRQADLLIKLKGNVLLDSSNLLL
ncbi:MAG: hypothetical protein RLZZ124_1272, partial [Cyanobacteriota bacterium]